MRHFASGAAIAIATLVWMAAPAGAQSPVPDPSPVLSAFSQNGDHVVFATSEGLVPEDADGPYPDVYLWSNGVLEPITVAIPTNDFTGNPWGRAVSNDGDRVIFEDDERLDPADDDLDRDLYAWTPDGDYEMLSTGPADTTTGYGSVQFQAASPDARRVLFSSRGDLTPDDGGDFYERFDGVTRRLSTQAIDPPHATRFFLLNQASPDASRALVYTPDRITSEDTDGQYDVYEVSATSKQLVSKGTYSNESPQDITAAAASEQLDHVLLATRQRLEFWDLDDRVDVYLRSGGTTRLISRSGIFGNGAFDAAGRAVSNDGTRVVFETKESLRSSDGDSETDLYEWTASGVQLLSTGPGTGNAAPMTHVATSPDGSRTLFKTTGALTTNDTDTTVDLYERAGGVTRLISGGSQNMSIDSGAGQSRDLTRVFFGTSEQLAPEDTDTKWDVYEAHDGALTLVTTGPLDPGASAVQYLRGTPDGLTYFWSTPDRLVAEDTDDPGAPVNERQDIYRRRGGVTTLLTPDP